MYNFNPGTCGRGTGKLFTTFSFTFILTLLPNKEKAMATTVQRPAIHLEFTQPVQQPEQIDLAQFNLNLAGIVKIQAWARGFLIRNLSKRDPEDLARMLLQQRAQNNKLEIKLRNARSQFTDDLSRKTVLYCISILAIASIANLAIFLHPGRTHKIKEPIFPPSKWL